MKKFLFIMMAIFAFGLQNARAQDAPLKIITNHPDFDVKVKRCAASGKSVIIDMVFTNKSDKDVMIDVIANANGYWTVVYDDEGNKYEGIKGAITTKVANSGSYAGKVTDYRLISGIPVKVSFCINNVSTTAENIAYFEGVVFCKEWGIPAKDKWLIIRNIPITRN